MALHIRDFREADRHHVLGLWEICALTRPWNMPDGDIDRAIHSREATLLVGLESGQVIATVMVGHDGHRGWVYYLAVAPDHQNRGRAREMLAEAELWRTMRKIPKVQLMVRTDKPETGRVYEALGYERQPVSVFGKWLRDGDPDAGG